MSSSLCVQELKKFSTTAVVLSGLCSGCVKHLLGRTLGREAGRRGSRVNIGELLTSLKLFTPGRRVFAEVPAESRVALNL